LIGDAWVDLVITDGVDVTTICRMGRSIPAALRTAITERDRSCVVPGCDATKGLEFDHWQTDYADGGPLFDGQSGSSLSIPPLPADPSRLRPLGRTGEVVL
jgi:hypothetical protein